LIISALLVSISLIGAVILAAGLIKTISPYGFRTHLESLGFIPPQLVAGLTVVSAAIEVAWGTALLLQVSLSFLLPASILGLVILSGITWFSSRNASISDCGCYGGYVSLSPAQSIALNAAFITVLAVSWFAGVRGEATLSSTSIIVIAIGALAGLFTFAAERHDEKHGEPLVDVSPIKVGNRWKDSWAAGATRGLKGEFFVSFMGLSCPCCKLWVKVANAMTHSPEMPQVFGVVAASQAQIASFVHEYRVTFPVSHISQSLMARMTRQVPTTAVIRDGVIQDIFFGLMPAEHSTRLVKAYFPGVSIRQTSGLAEESQGEG
jgi:hypothetical protein